VNSDINKKAARFDTAAKRERLNSPEIVQPTKATRFPSMSSHIFEVQSAAAGDGVYNCYEQIMGGDTWDDTSGLDKFGNKEESPSTVEVFNLDENDPDADYTPAMGKYDRLACWPIRDDDSNERTVGVPMLNPVRIAKTTEDPSTGDKITCNLILNNGVEATSGQLGYQIEVYCELNGGSKLNEAIPLLKSGQYIYVVNINGVWWSQERFNTGDHTQTAWVKTAPTGTTVTCWLSHTDNEGAQITFTPYIVGDGNLDKAAPQLQDGTPLTVRKLGTTFSCVNIFQALNTDQLEVESTDKKLQTKFTVCS